MDGMRHRQMAKAAGNGDSPLLPPPRLSSTLLRSRLRTRISPHLRPFSGRAPCDVLSSTPQTRSPASDHICGNLHVLASGSHE